MQEREERGGERREANRGGSPRKRRTPRTYTCTICERTLPFCWTCPCGFAICQECLAENAWGLTCNNVTWECPDCGEFRSF